MHALEIVTSVAVMLFAASSGASASGVESQGTPELPSWLLEKLVSPEVQNKAGKRSAAYRTTYKGATVYFLPPICCDIPSAVYSEQGTLVCQPSGGFAGGDSRCPGFDLAPKSMARVWPLLTRGK